MAFADTYPYTVVSQSAGDKKWVSAVPVADYGQSQALWRRPGTPTLNALEVGAYRLVNNAGAAVIAGLGGRFATSAWRVGQITNLNAYTDVTTQAQNATAGDVVLYQRVLTDGNGLMVSATEPFNTLSLLVSTVGDQTSPVLLVQYWNGTAYTTIPSAAMLMRDALFTPTGEKLLAWHLPPDWVPGGSGTLVPQTHYNLRVTHTVGGAGTVDPLVSQIFVGLSRFFAAPVGNMNMVSFDMYPPTRFPKVCDAAFPLFSVASPANYVDMYYRSWG